MSVARVPRGGRCQIMRRDSCGLSGSLGVGIGNGGIVGEYDTSSGCLFRQGSSLVVIGSGAGCGVEGAGGNESSVRGLGGGRGVEGAIWGSSSSSGSFGLGAGRGVEGAWGYDLLAFGLGAGRGVEGAWGYGSLASCFGVGCGAELDWSSRAGIWESSSLGGRGGSGRRS